jgi:Ca2+-transporting ATPase
MLTGDHRATALAVARELGLVADADEAIEGSALDGMSDDALASRIDRIGIASRVSPEGKLRIIAAQQRRGEVVAMIGDGINDAAALKKANIGVAMGRRGTDAAKEVAGIVLGDDRFPTIAAAVEEGRVVVANIRKFVFYLFSCNIAEVISLLVAGIGGLPLPMTPLQVLWMNLVTDTFPALALAIEPAEEGVLRQRPRDPKAPLLSRRVVWRGVGYSILIAGVTVVALVVGLRLWPGQVSRTVTLSFTTLSIAQIFHLGNARGHGPVLTFSRITSNRYALGAVALTLALQVLAVAWRPLGNVLGTTPLEAQGWLLAFALSAIPAIVGQTWRVVSGYAGTTTTPHRAP